MCVARFLCAALFRSYAPPQAVLSVAPFTFWIERRVFSSVSDPCRSQLPMSSLHYCPQWNYFLSRPHHIWFLVFVHILLPIKMCLLFSTCWIATLSFKVQYQFIKKKKNVLFITPSKVIQGYFVTCHMGTTSAQFMLHTRLQMPGRPELFSINLS